MRKIALRLAACMLFLLSLAGCNTELFSNLEEREANEMLAVLAANGIPAQKSFTKKTNFVLTVDESQMAEAIQTLKRLGYPKDDYADMGQVFQKDGLISSPLEERARYVYAVSQDLSDTLSRVDGVIDAKVHVVLPELDVTGNIVKPPTASVFIKHQSDFNLQPFLPKMKLLVNKSVEGIDYQDISIALFPSEVKRVDQEDQWAQFLGIKVHPGSKGRMVMFFGLLLALVVASLAATFALSRKGKPSLRSSSSRPADNRGASQPQSQPQRDRKVPQPAKATA